jgi:hypothetical protein
VNSNLKLKYNPSSKYISTSIHHKISGAMFAPFSKTEIFFYNQQVDKPERVDTSGGCSFA